MFLQLSMVTFIWQLYWSSIHQLQELWELWISIAEVVRIMSETVICHTMTSVPCFTWEHVFLNFLTWLITYFHTLAALQWWKATVPATRTKALCQWLSIRLLCSLCCDHSSLMERSSQSRHVHGKLPFRRSLGKKLLSNVKFPPLSLQSTCLF
jgi:hypothetical protein